MNEIKLYEPLSLVFYKDIDGKIDVLTIPQKSRESFIQKLQTAKFIEVEGVLINVYNIQKCVDVTDDLESIYYSQAKSFRDSMNKRYHGIGLLEDLNSKYNDLELKKKKLLDIIHSFYNPVKYDFLDFNYIKNANT